MANLRQGEIDEDLPYPCAIGYYGDSTGVVSQDGFSCMGPCPVGMVCDQVAVVTPLPCPEGHWCSGGIARPCAIATYSLFNATDELRASPLSCRHCPEFSTTRTFGSASVNDCGCNPGYFDDSDFANRDEHGDWLGPHCVECPIGATCDTFNTTEATRGYECPWLFYHTETAYEQQCADGSYCNIYLSGGDCCNCKCIAPHCPPHAEEIEREEEDG